MLRYAARRIATGIILIVLVSAITYWLLSFSFDSILANRLLTAANTETVAALKAELASTVRSPCNTWTGSVGC
ncbi:hypothetical protein C1I63_18010 [Rathayibacter caricis DSM 15933]|uniref:Uncharacterized protein n=1 Tax=Rathayibacter caricis DSM 15933 TaxID=1328867 RepID=A0A2T4UNP1_9MICO|nr:hypothetical protein [Rathayibacter caricis]PTL71150.1 hypothetical protein C1I63_18010 [Rathayibacter caricis DSM 15933]